MAKKKKTEKKLIEPGTRLFAVATGMVSPFMKQSREAVDYITHLDGFTAVNFTPDGNYTLWLFDSVENAIFGKNLMNSKGIEVGNNISEFEVLNGETLQFKGVAAGKDKGKGYDNEKGVAEKI